MPICHLRYVSINAFWTITTSTSAISETIARHSRWIILSSKTLTDRFFSCFFIKFRSVCMSVSMKIFRERARAGRSNKTRWRLRKWRGVWRWWWASCGEVVGHGFFLHTLYLFCTLIFLSFINLSLLPKIPLSCNFINHSLLRYMHIDLLTSRDVLIKFVRLFEENW